MVSPKAMIQIVGNADTLFSILHYQFSIPLRTMWKENWNVS